MDRPAVSVATGALGPVVEKLTALLVQERFWSHLGSAACRRDIELIKSKLGSLHSLLLRIWEREDLDAECKKWMIDARELSYDMDDGIDDFMLGLERSDVGRGTSVKTLFRRFKTRVVDVSRRCREEWKNIAPAQAISNRIVDPRARFVHKDASELVGMDEPKGVLLKLLKEHEMVCIHGFAGTGKTTLADLVYHETRHEYQCRAFVSLSRSPDMLEVLQDILSQVTNGGQSVVACPTPSTEAAATEQNLVNDISSFLSNKRYMVIVDDIWDWQAWKIIRRALPAGVPRCRILTTTRVNDIAEKCGTEESAGICRHNGLSHRDATALSRTVLGKECWVRRDAVRETGWKRNDDIADLIAATSWGRPLAVTCLSLAVAGDNFIEHYYSHRKILRLTAEDEMWFQQVVVDWFQNDNPSLKPLAESLRLGYDDLPIHLKTCLLYCSMFQQEVIEKHELMRKWMAEGFIYHQAAGEEEDDDEEAAAEACLDVLVSRDLLQPMPSENYRRVHSMMLAFLVSKSREANFVYTFPERHHRSSSFSSCGRIRRLSVRLQRRYGGWPDDLNSLDLTSTRSLAVFGTLQHDDFTSTRHMLRRPNFPRSPQHLPFPWEQLERLRVLSIDDVEFLFSGGNLQAMCRRLHRMRYLGLTGKKLSFLPQKIGRLQNLETLDVSFSRVEELPKEIGKLQHLKTLDVSETEVRHLPREIGQLQHLETLDMSCCTNVMHLPREIVKLQHLKTLDISVTKVGHLPREIGELQHLKNLDVSFTKLWRLPREIGELQHLKTLDISYTKNARHLPREIGKLQHLKTLDVSHSNVQELPACLFPSLVSVLFGANEELKLSDGALAVLKHWNKDDNTSALVKHGVDLSLMLYDDSSSYSRLPFPGHTYKVVSREIRGVPECVKQHLADVSSLDISLCSLKEGDDDLGFLCKMPNLKFLTLRLQVLPRTPIVITQEGFSMLERFCIDCRLPLVIFQTGAMPKLEHLKFKFYASRALTTEDPVGIRHLLSLKTVVFERSRYRSDAPGISVVINKVREEAKEHPNKITISVNGEAEEVIQEKKAAVTSASDRTSQGNIVTTNGGSGGSSEATMIQLTNLPIPYNNDTDDEKGGNIIPVKSYYPFGVSD